MKLVFVLTLIISSLQVLGQKEDVIYSWEEAKNANPDTIYAISFHKMKLDSLPEKLAEFKQLNYLDLTKNKLTFVPFYFREFKKLHRLKLERNKLDAFPLALCSMGSIDTLEIGGNDISTLPNCILNLSSLVYLDIYDNPVRDFPEGLMALENLKKVDVSGVRFSAKFQQYWMDALPNVEFVFDAPCACMD